MSKIPILQISGAIPVNLNKQDLVSALNATCEVLGLSNNVVVSLVFCSTDEIQLINSRFRGVDKPTDVLSFPADQKTGLYSYSQIGAIYLGEILIDTNCVLMDSDNNSKSDIEVVFVHGLLHLLGFDHLRMEQKTKMQSIESQIRNLIN